MFDKIANWASVISLIISFFALKKVYILRKEINIDNSNNIEQNLKAKDNENTDIKQSGGDIG